MAIRPTTGSVYDPGTSGTETQYYDSTKFVPELYSKKVLRKS